MTDVQVTLEGDDHVLSTTEALAKAKELTRLAQYARLMDAPQPEFIVANNNLITREHAGVAVAKHTPFGSPGWSNNTTRLWRKIIEIDRMGNQRNGYRRFTFTKMCYDCNVPLARCRRQHYEQRVGVPAHEFELNKQAFSPLSVGLSTNYSQLLKLIEEHVTSS